MDDDKKQEDPGGAPNQNPPLKPYTRRESPDKPAGEVSLFDLMNEGMDSDVNVPTVVGPAGNRPSELPPLVKSNPPTAAEPPAAAQPVDPAAASKTPAQPPKGIDPTITITLDDIEGGGDTPADQATGDRTTTAPQPPAAQPRPAAPATQATPATQRPPQTMRPPEAIPPQEDMDATIVRPNVAFPGAQRPTSDLPTQAAGVPGQTQGTTRPAGGQPAARPAQPKPAGPVRETKPAGPPRPPAPPPPAVVPAPKGSGGQGFLRAMAILAVSMVVLFLLAASGAAIVYSVVASDLPNPTELRDRASSFETARIFDRNGELLYAQADPNAGNRTYVPLSQISPYLIQATIATEDKRFYENPGFDIIGLTRAVIDAAVNREAIAGTSTITQQLVRATLLNEDERTERSFRRKVRELFLAAEISRTYTKDEILELYLNEIYYGNLAYGIEAASQTYFQKPASDLTLAEASLLAGLPQAPALWDPYSAPDKAVGRQREVLSLMVANDNVTLQDAQAALDEMAQRVYNLEQPTVTIRHPHFALTVLQQAEELLGAQSIYRGGLSIQTTLDPAAQQLAERVISEARPQLNAGGANNAALVALQPETGEILAMVGSIDFNDESISGQVNMALVPRQTGSAIKPLVYLSAFEKGWTPSTLLWDVPTEFPDGANPPYAPKNYDDEFHGPLRIRPALGNSYNVPAVKALEFVGVCEFIANVQKVGLHSLQDTGCAGNGIPRDHGLSLALGGGEIPPLEMAGGFATLANQGRFIAPYAIQRITDRQGRVLYDQATLTPAPQQVVRPEHAYLLTHILSDNNARQPEFGADNSLVIPGYPTAVKTGTSGSTREDVRDGWTIGYAPQVLTTVWIGNTDNEPIGAGQSGYQLATPIWNRFMTEYLAGRQPLDFIRPPGIVQQEVCATTGTVPGPGCTQRIPEVFAGDQPPLNDPALATTTVDRWTGLAANNFCPEATYPGNFGDVIVFGRPEVLDRERALALNWLQTTPQGQAWAAQAGIGLPLRPPPVQQCDANTPRPRVEINRPAGGSEVTGEIEIGGTVAGPNYAGYQVEYGLGENPGGWGLIQGQNPNTYQDGPLARWDTAQLGDYSGPVTIRVIIFGPDNPFTAEFDPVTAEDRITLRVTQPTPTPTATPTATGSPTPTATATPTETPTALPSLTPTATWTPLPSATAPVATSPVETPTSEPTATPEILPTLPAPTPYP
jgi:penicillin-binding protein 1C